MNNENINNPPKTSSQEEIKVLDNKADLDNYSDLNGVTVKQLEKGLWWVENNKFIKRTLFWFLLSIGMIAWLFTVGSFLYYWGFSMAKDNQNFQNLTTTGLVNHQALVANTAQPLTIASNQQVLNSTVGRYDFAIKVRNPNKDYYAAFNFLYLVDGTSTALQSDFILPNEEKYLQVLGYEAGNIANVELKILDVTWRRLNRHEIPDWAAYKNSHLNFLISEPKFYSSKDSGLSEKLEMNSIDFTITNNSPFNYYLLPLNAYLYAFNQLIGVTMVNVDRFASGELRPIRISYPGSADNVDRIEIVPNLDILNNDIYFDFKGDNLSNQK